MSNKNYELRHLRYFMALAEERHFARAAQRCNVSQPPFSVAIRQLENELGFELIDRTQMPLKLTPAGTAFYEETAKTMFQLQHAVQTAERYSQGLGGILKIGFFASMLCRGLPEVLKQMKHERPDLNIRLIELSSQEQIAALQRGMIDYGFVHSTVTAEKANFDLLLSEPFVLCVPDMHPAAQQSSVNLADFRHEEFVLFQRAVSSNYYDQVIALCVNAGFQPLINHEVRQWSTVISCVGNGLGIALVPRSLQRMNIDHVAFLSIEPGDIQSPLWGAWMEGTANNAALLALREAIKKIIHD